MNTEDMQARPDDADLFDDYDEADLSDTYSTSATVVEEPDNAPAPPKQPESQAPTVVDIKPVAAIPAPVPKKKTGLAASRFASDDPPKPKPVPAQTPELVSTPQPTTGVSAPSPTLSKKRGLAASRWAAADESTEKNETSEPASPEPAVKTALPSSVFEKTAEAGRGRNKGLKGKKSDVTDTKVEQEANSKYSTTPSPELRSNSHNKNKSKRHSYVRASSPLATSYVDDQVTSPKSTKSSQKAYHKPEKKLSSEEELRFLSGANPINRLPNSEVDKKIAARKESASISINYDAIRKGQEALRSQTKRPDGFLDAIRTAQERPRNDFKHHGRLNDDSNGSGARVNGSKELFPEKFASRQESESTFSPRRDGHGNGCGPNTRRNGHGGRRFSDHRGHHDHSEPSPSVDMSKENTSASIVEKPSEPVVETPAKPIEFERIQIANWADEFDD